MKNVNKIISVVIVISMAVSICASVFAQDTAENSNIIHSDVPYNERSLVINAEETVSVITKFQEACRIPDNTKMVFDCYQKIVEQWNKIYTVEMMNMIERNKIKYNVGSDYTKEFLDQNYILLTDAMRQIEAALESVLDTEYADEFTEYWGQEKTNTIRNLNKNRELAEKQNNIFERYYDIVNNPDISSEQKSLEAAKLLKEQIEYYNQWVIENTEYDNYGDFAYKEIYYRDYDPEEIQRYVNNVVMAYNSQANKYSNYAKYLGLTETPERNVAAEQVVDVFGKYIGRLSPQMKDSYDYMVKNRLYQVYNASSSNRVTGFTTGFTAYKDSSIFVASSNPLGTFVHEFGHYNSFYYDKHFENPENSIFSNIIADVCEIASLGMELIFTGFYDDIYGVDADKMRYKAMEGIINNFVSNAVYGSIEIDLYQNIDINKVSAQELNSYMTYNLSAQWYNQSLFFTNPFYSVGYSLAAFDALQIFDLYLKDKEAGLQMYSDLLSYGNYDCSYKEVTHRLGLTEPFNDKAAEMICNKIENIYQELFGFTYDTALGYFKNEIYIGKVEPTKQTVSVDRAESAPLYAYNKDGYNYIKIRDLAMLLNGTEKQFNVEYNEETDTINIITGQPYIPDGSESASLAKITTAGVGTATLLVDGKPSKFGCIFINGNNCYRLRGLVDNKILNFELAYDEDTNTVSIMTH